MAYRNTWLLLASLFFYAWGEPFFVLMMLLSIIWNYAFGLLVSKEKSNDAFRRTALAVSVTGNILFLGAYKYLNFVTYNILECIPAARGYIPQTEIVLPIGISFFTFQAMSYVIDAYRGMPAQRNPFTLALYVSLFPQLVAGPIVRYSTIAKELVSRVSTIDGVSSGFIRFLIGFNKKMLLANPLSECADYAFAHPAPSSALAWTGALCYTFQIFFDFSGYSDMAIGIGKMLGFNFCENFNYPYIARSFTEFWRRWHISLGSWFRDYVYFPLGGSRTNGKLLLVRNLMAVWLLTGIWHGANWTFIIWGILYGCLITIEKVSGLSRLTEHRRLIPYQIFVILTVILAWVVFRANSLTAACEYIASMFCANEVIYDGHAAFWIKETAVLLPLALLFSTPLPARICEAVKRAVRVNIQSFAQLPLFLVSISSLVMENHNPFIYFSF